MGIELIKDAILSNDNYDEKSKNLLIDSFENIYSFLNEHNYIQYVNEEKLISRLKEVKISIVDHHNAFINIRKNVKAHYNYNENKLTYVDEYYGMGEVVTHENYHLLSNFNLVCLPVFLNEGVTEYLTHLTENISPHSYKINVNFASFLHSVVGDVLIQAYLEDNPSKLYQVASFYLGEESNIDFNYRIKQLNSCHYAFNNISRDYNKREVENNYKKAIVYILKLYYKKLEYDLNHYKYYNKNILFKEFIDDVSNVLYKLQLCVSAWSPKKVIDTICETFIENSPYSIFPDKKKRELKDTLVYTIKEKINYKTYKKSLAKVDRVINDLSKIYKVENANIIAYFNHKYALNFDNSNLVEYINNIIECDSIFSFNRSELKEIINVKKGFVNRLAFNVINASKINHLEVNNIDQIKTLIYQEVANMVNYEGQFDINKYIMAYREIEAIISKSDLSSIEKITSKILFDLYGDNKHVKSLVNLIATKITYKKNFGKYNDNNIIKKIDETKNLYYKSIK